MYLGESGQSSHFSEAENLRMGIRNRITQGFHSARCVCVCTYTIYVCLEAHICTLLCLWWVILFVPKWERATVGCTLHLWPLSPAFLSVPLARNRAVGGEEGRERGREGLGRQLLHSLSPHPRTHCPQHTDTSCWHDQEF